MDQQNLSYNSLQGQAFTFKTKKSWNCCCNICNLIFCWLFTLGTWTFLIIILYRITHPEYEEHTVYIVFGIIIYIIYLIFEFCSTSLRIILSISNNDIYDKIKNIIQGKPIISLNCICYHIETGYRDRGGSYQVTVVTFRDSYKFPYYSVRDCSGPIILKSNSKNIKYKLLLNLNINKKIFLADNDTISDCGN